MLISKVKQIAFLVGLFCCSLVYAGNDPIYTNSLLGREGRLVTNAELLTVDNNFLVFREQIEKTLSIKNIVSLSIDEHSNKFIPSDFTATVAVMIKAKDTNNVVTTYEKALQVNYKKDGGTEHSHAAYFAFDGAVEIDLKVISIDKDVAWNAIEVLQLKSDILVERDYKFNCNALIPGLGSGGVVAGEWNVTWGNPDIFQTEFDVEWAWIDESAVSEYFTGSSIDIEKVFSNNATRVTTSTRHYKIPLLYDGTGSVYVRVRPAQVRSAERRLEGRWTYLTSGGTYLKIDFTGHETNLNWQATTTFAEDGKRKSVVQYFDGSLRGRQTVTKDNSTGTTVVAETFYDYQGRPVIQVLPAPTISTIVAFTKNFNQFDDSGPAKSVYDKLDITESACAKLTKRLKNISDAGVAQYYSASNANINSDFNKYIPDAEGYAYTETRYTSDGTGRIEAQGGVGANHQANSGHDTKYYYQSVEQRELDALFGTDAGVASHYFKNVVKDANGQYSVSYVDMQGRTIATALAGISSTTPLQALTSEATATKMLTRQLLDEETNVISGRSVVSSKSLIVPVIDDYEFQYSLNPDQLNLLNCASGGTPAQPVCYDCLYELKISIIADCKENVIEDISSPGTPVAFNNPILIRNFTLGEYLNSCRSDGKSPAFSYSFKLRLPEGAYTIVKELKLSAEAQEYYKAVYADENTCKSLTDYVNTQYQLMLNQRHCYTTCDECSTKVGSTLAEFRNNFKTASGLPDSTLAKMEAEIAAAYAEAKDNCERLCVNEMADGFDEIRAIKQTMLNDVTPPYGQYADPVKASAIYSIYARPFPFSFRQPGYMRPTTYSETTGITTASNYLDEYGLPVEPYTTKAKAGEKDFFTSQFRPSFAAQLLPHHPEFSKLVLAETRLKSTYQFEAEMLKTETWSEALAKGYVTNINSILSKDKFFTDVTGTLSYFNRMNTALSSSYISESAVCAGVNVSINVSIWKLAQIAVKCRNALEELKSKTFCNLPTSSAAACFNSIANTDMPDPFQYCSADLNTVWKNFRTFYLSFRKALISDYLENNTSFFERNAFIKGLGYQPRFRIVSAGRPYIQGTGEVYDLINGSHDGNAFNNAMNRQADSACIAHAGNWIMRLRQCPDIDAKALTLSASWKADSTNLVRLLVDVCKKGVDYMGHPFGASSLPAGEPATADGFRSFQEIIANYLSNEGIAISASCHPYLIDYPPAYENAPPVVPQTIITKPSECECKRINDLKVEAASQGYSTINAFRSYLEVKHGTYLTNDSLQFFINLCNVATTCKFLDKPIALPAIFQCRGTASPMKTCITCEEYNQIKSDFSAALGLTGPIKNPANDTEVAINRAFQAFANHHTGFSKSWLEYVEFENTCDASGGEYPCTGLETALNDFKLTATYLANTTGTACKTAFADFMNARFSTFFSFDQWMALFYQNCGYMPDICKPVLTCVGFKATIDSFYKTYGVSIYQNTNCSNLFTTFVNSFYQSNYTYSELNERYKYLCKSECDLDICTFPNAYLLTKVYQDFIKYNPLAWTSEACSEQFTNYFNNYFSFTSEPWDWAAIRTAYEAKESCVPDINAICTPPFSCEILNKVLETFYAETGEEVSRDTSCARVFTQYFNIAMRTNYTFAQVRSIYFNVCRYNVPICEPKFDCETLLLATSLFKSTVVYTAEDCNEKFVAFFNDQFGTAYASFEAVNEVYLNTCGEALHVCEEEVPISNCEQLQQVLNEFMSAHPNPAEEFGGMCQNAFKAFFNEHFRTNHEYSVISNFYSTICHTLLDVCISRCYTISSFSSDHLSRYGTLKLPLRARQQLFAYRYSKEFYPTDPKTFAELEEVTACAALPAAMYAETELIALTDPYVLHAFKTAYYLMHPERMPEDCNNDFANWVNWTMDTVLRFEELQVLYNTTIGEGAGDICTTPEEMRGIVIEGVAPPVTVPIVPMLCGLNIPVFAPPAVDTSNCEDPLVVATIVAEEKYKLYKDSLADVFDVKYMDKCMAARLLESFTVTHRQAEHHYTLYYYDQAGNLVKTVPPAGVNAKHDDATFLADVKAKRANALLIGAGSTNKAVPAHTLVTHYRYNTLNQVVEQSTPDAGVSKFWYDRLGRLVISQNANQAITGAYSYTLYDNLGRITEVGQASRTDAMTQVRSQNVTNLASWLNAGTAEQVTRTVYDRSYFNGDDLLKPEILVQRNLRNRVSYTAVFSSLTVPGEAGGAIAGTHTTATYYTYDIHGNVDTLVQDLRTAMAWGTNRYKKVAYNYDLVSGKVNRVSYQAGAADQFFHKYSYDGENRLNKVFTSSDNLLWEEDANYFYYKHGPLARTLLGQNKVQGVDYAYTLHGWLKGVNSTGVMPATATGSFDMGQDGVAGTANSSVARDAYAFSLNYYSGDYSAINSTVAPFAPIISSIGTASKSLYNGNIAAMAVNIPKLGAPQVYNYRYDQLNRLTAMDAYSGLNNSTNVFTPVLLDQYQERISYDANGNILSYKRNGDAARTAMDDMTYHYTAGTNKLHKVTDAASDAATGDYDKYGDIKQGQANNNYVYDAIGNLVEDISEGITITWNVYGKINSITKKNTTGVTEQVINYSYDAAGNRIAKSVDSYAGGSISSTKHTIYVRDASGNVMAVYEKKPDLASGYLAQTEVHLYGSSRLGLWHANRQVESAPVKDPGEVVLVKRGKKVYELTNHLGNVLATISDRKQGVDSDSDGDIDYYEADVVSANDYYAGGMQMPGRQYTAGSQYRYCYQGSERDGELNSNTYTTLFRELDTRINRWWSRDPKAAASPWSSPYVVNGNNPIIMIDPLGDKEYESIKAYRKATGNKKLGQGDWLTKDRTGNTDVWKKANEYNLKQEKGFEEYTNIEQRAAFYGWFQEASEAKGFETKWAGAASQVAFAINEMANPTMAGINVKWVAKQLNYTSDDANAFANTGNRMIFEDVFPKLRTLYSGPVIKGQEAFNWDAMALSQEQNLIQPLYETTKAFGTVSAASKQLFAGSSALAWMKDINIKPFPKDGNLMDVSQRWAYGMQGMGHKVVPSQMPLPGATYTNGTMYLKFRGAVDKKHWNTPKQ